MWKWTVKAPDGREFGPYWSQHEADHKAHTFNRDIPRGGMLATVRMEPVGILVGRPYESTWPDGMGL